MWGFGESMENKHFPPLPEKVGASQPVLRWSSGHLAKSPVQEQLEQLALLLMSVTHIEEQVRSVDWGRAVPEPAGIRR